MADQTTITVDLEREELSKLLDYLQTEARRYARLADMLDSPHKADEKRQRLELEQHYRKRHWLLSRAHLHGR